MESHKKVYAQAGIIDNKNCKFALLGDFDVKFRLHRWLLHDNMESEWPAVHAEAKTQNDFHWSISKRRKKIPMSKHLICLAYSSPTKWRTAKYQLKLYLPPGSLSTSKPEKYSRYAKWETFFVMFTVWKNETWHCGSAQQQSLDGWLLH